MARRSGTFLRSMVSMLTGPCDAFFSGRQRAAARSPPSIVRAVRFSSASEVGLELHPPGTRLVDHAGQVVEVDAADDADLVGDVAAEHRHLVLVAGPLVAQPQSAFQQGLAAEFGGLVEEEVDL